jgi:hypothetical protein
VVAEVTVVVVPVIAEALRQAIADTISALADANP